MGGEEDQCPHVSGTAVASEPSGALITCADTGEDRDIQAGVPFPTPRFTNAMRFGVANARRAWLEAENVLNTRGPEVFLKQLHHGHR